jgi:hypothetical protein
MSFWQKFRKSRSKNPQIVAPEVRWTIEITSVQEGFEPVKMLYGPFEDPIFAMKLLEGSLTKLRESAGELFFVDGCVREILVLAVDEAS